MKNFLELVKKRYSVRNYLEKAVEDEKLNYILECGRLAPSAANFQPWQIFVIKDREMRETLGVTYNRPWFLLAPVVLVICGDHQKGWKRSDGKDHTDTDIAIITDHLTLAAAEQDLGTCWICNFDAAASKTLLNLPDHLEPIVYLTLGYPSPSTDDNARHLRRKSMEEIITFGG